MKVCLKCKSELNDDAKFCPICGSKLEEKSSEENLESSNSNHNSVEQDNLNNNLEKINLTQDDKEEINKGKKLNEVEDLCKIEKEDLKKFDDNKEKNEHDTEEENNISNCKSDNGHTVKNKFLEKIKNKENTGKIFVGMLIVILILIVSIIFIEKSKISSNNVAQEKIERLENEKSDLENLISTKDNEIENLKIKVEEAKPWFDMKEEERQKKEAEEQKKREEKEAQEREAKENEEKKGYETGITYNQLARTPDDNKGKLVKFSGKIIQVMESDENSAYRMAVDGSYNTVLYLIMPKDLVKNNRVLENDYITIYGKSGGTITYQSTGSGNITIPAVLVDKISR